MWTVVLSHYWNSFWLVFPFNSSMDLYKIIQNFSCFLFLLVCCIPRVTQLKSWIKHHVVKTSLHLITFNQFQNWFKTRFTTITCKRDDLSPVFATPLLDLSITLHSSKQNVLCGSELIVDHKTQRKIGKNWEKAKITRSYLTRTPS